MPWRYLLIVLLVGVVLFQPFAGAVFSAEQVSTPVRAASEKDYPPYCIVTENEKPDGFSVELLRAALAAMGRDVTFETGVWSDVFQDLIRGRVQVLPLVGRTPEREGLFDFTFPYLSMHGSIIVREDSRGISGSSDLRGKRVAVMKGDNAEEYLRRSNLGAVIVPRPSFEIALRELSAGRHDAVVIQKLVAFQLMQKAGLNNLRAVGPPLAGLVQSFCFAVRKGDHQLLAVLNEGLAIVMADGTFRRLYAKWFSLLETSIRKKSRIVIGGDSDYPPYEYLDRNGQPAGFNVDLTRAIARQTGLNIHIQLGQWGDIREKLQTGEIDAVQGMFYSPQRDRVFDFSTPSTVVQHAIVTRKGDPSLNDLQGLAGKSIIVMSGDVMEDLAIQHGYRGQIVSVSSQEQALRLLSSGKHDCALVAKVPALYWIKKNRWRNLVVSDAPVHSAEYCYAVPEGKDTLLAQFSEGLAVIRATGEYREIRDKWLSSYDDKGTNFKSVLIYVFATTLLLLAMLVGTVLWNRSLRKQVDSRTGELRNEVAERTRTAQELLVAKEQAEAANRAKSSFLANMSHELRTPLNAILGFSNFLRCENGLSERQVANLSIISKSGEHLLTLINDVLDMSKIEAGRDAIEEVEFDLAGVVRDVMELMDMRAVSKGLHLELDQSSKFPPFIKTDQVKLRQILINLIGNAVKFTESGTVRVRMDTRHLAVPGRTMLLIDVEDTGPGIAVEDRERVFEPFVQIGHVATGKGTGLGLAITRQFVEIQGGRIFVEDSPGAGALFRVELPVGIVEYPVGTKGVGTEGRVIGLVPDQIEYRILIVEDEQENWLLLRQILEQVGFRVQVAENGAQGLDVFRAWRPHFIWMDIRMPVMDGLEATRRIRRLEGGHEVRIAACTASVMGESAEQCLLAGMDDFIRKPYRPDEIFACLVRNLGVAFIRKENPEEATLELLEKIDLEKLAALPPELIGEMTEALISLEEKRIAVFMQKLSEIDPCLVTVIGRYVDKLAYTEVLHAIQNRGNCAPLERS